MNQSTPYNHTFLSKYELLWRIEGKLRPEQMNACEAAYEMAESVHEFQRRNDGTPYIWHPSRVAKIILDELKIMDPDMICAALLHDVLEDSPTLTPQILEYNFNPYVAYVVETLTKDIKAEGELRDQIDKQYVKKISVASDDCKIIKLADRLDNCRCLVFNVKRNPIRYVTETCERYLPMAQEAKNPHLNYLSRELHKESSKFFG